MTDILDFFGGGDKARYSHIAKSSRASIDVSADEMASVLWAYDYGLDKLDKEALADIANVISKLKDELWP